MIVLQDFNAHGARFADTRGIAHWLGIADLVALAQEGRDARSLQRAPGFLSPRGSITACDRIADGWQVGFADGAFVTVAAAQLQALFAGDTPSVPRTMWSAADSAPPVHDYQAVMAEPAARLACLRQVLSLGYARLANVPQVPGTVAEFLASFGPVRETNYGTVFDVRVQPDPGNLADTALALLPHTDNPYRTTPPDLQVLHAIVAAPEGGETWLVDGLTIVAHLRRTAPDALALLAQVPVRFAWADANWRLAAVEPVIGLAADGALHRLRVNSRSLDCPVETDPVRRAAWWAAWDCLETVLADADFAQTFALGAGELVIMDNRRVLHGRTGFAGATGARHLQGAYADIDGLTSQVLRLAEVQADAAVDALGALFLGPDMGNRYGEAVSIREHMLQSAELAAARGLGDHAVAAALLHDIGWARDADYPPPHERAAADRLRAVFGARVADPVLWHVEAKRYLVARHSGYHECLSPASRETLRQQGGPMDDAECARFEALPDHDVYCALRLVDDAGKDMAAAHSVWADYGPLLRRLAVRHLLHQE